MSEEGLNRSVLNNQTDKLLFTFAEAGEIANVSPSLLRKLVRNKQLEVVKISRTVRVPRHELLRLCGVTEQVEVKQ